MQTPGDTTAPPGESPLARALRGIAGLRPGEGAAVVWSALAFFFILGGYFVARPVRDTLGLRSPDELSWLYMGTVGAMIAINPVFVLLVRRFPRRVFIPAWYAFFISNLLVFVVLERTLPDDARLTLAKVFFVWLSVFNLSATSLFWALMADLFRSGQAKRLFGLIGVGGTTGAVLSSLFMASIGHWLVPAGWMLVSAGSLALGAACLLPAIRSASRVSATPLLDPAETASSPTEPAGTGGALRGLALVARSPYLLAIGVSLLLFTVMSTVVWFSRTLAVGELTGDEQQRQRVFGAISLATQLATLGMQLFLTGRVLRWVGLGWALAVVPVVSFVGFVFMGVAPTLWVIAGVEVARSACNYGFSKPAREALFTVVTPEEKYKAKNFIDTVVYRAGDVVGALAIAGLTAAAFTMGRIALVAAPLGVAGVVIALYLGARQRARAAPEDPTPRLSAAKPRM